MKPATRWMLCFLCDWTGHTWAAFEHHLIRAHWLPRPPMPMRTR